MYGFPFFFCLWISPTRIVVFLLRCQTLTLKPLVGPLYYAFKLVIYHHQILLITVDYLNGLVRCKITTRRVFVERIKSHTLSKPVEIPGHSIDGAELLYPMLAK
jgi:hypothetical protein